MQPPFQLRKASCIHASTKLLDRRQPVWGVVRPVSLQGREGLPERGTTDDVSDSKAVGQT